MCTVLGKPKSGTENDKKQKMAMHATILSAIYYVDMGQPVVQYRTEVEHAFLETENPPSYDNLQEGKNSNRQLTITATAQMRSRTQTIPRQTHAAVNASQQNQQSYSVHM